MNGRGFVVVVRYGRGYQLDIGLHLPSSEDVARVQKQIEMATAPDAMTGGMIDAAGLLLALEQSGVLTDPEAVVSLFRKLLMNCGAATAVDIMDGDNVPLPGGSNSDGGGCLLYTSPSPRDRG